MAKGGRPRAKHKMSERLNANATEEEVADFKKACAELKFDPTVIIRQMASAFVTHVRDHKKMEFPMQFVPPK